MSPGPSSPAARAALACGGLALRLGGREVLRGASLALARGELGLLTGPSGSGKSALLKLFLGLRPGATRMALEGSVALLGQDALRTSTPVLARRAGLVFQDAGHQLTQPDVASELAFRPENLGLAPRDVEERVEGALRRFGLEALRARPLAALSGGEAKRVALAAVMAAEPEALLLDEPLGGLDAAWRARVLDDLRREAPGRATLVVEHRAAELARLRPRAWALVDGRVEPSLPPGRQALRARAGHARGRGAGERSPWPLVHARRLTVRAPGGRALVEALDLDLGPGLALLAGPNGAGKSTLLRALAGLAPHEGTLRVAGMDPGSGAPQRMARAVGYVPQRAEAMLGAASVREELAFGPRNLGTGDAAWQARLARDLDLGHLLDRHPWTLSGGEQQRLALACALAHRPRVLLLDEPTTGLDARGLARALAVLEGAGPGTLALVASHDPGLAGLADRVLRLEGGRLREARAAEVAA